MPCPTASDFAPVMRMMGGSTPAWLLRNNNVKKYTQEEAEYKIHQTQRDGYFAKLIDIYKGNSLKYKFECPICKLIFIRNFGNVVNYKAIFCNECSKIIVGKKNQLNEEQIRIEINNIIVDNYRGQYLNNYNGLNKFALFKCPICNSEFKRRPGDVRYWKLIFCKSCGIKRRTLPRTMSQSEFEDRCTQIGAIPLEPYGYNTEQKIKWQCSKCNNCFYRTPHEMFNSRSNCVTCGSCSKKFGATKRLMSEADVKHRDQKVGAVPIGKFKGTNHKRQYQCTKCGKNFMRQPDSVWRLKQINCLKCTRRNLISKANKSIFYIVQKILNISGDENQFLEQKISGWCGGIDILIGDIAIEFDGYYWHRKYKNATNREKRKEQAIKKAGYKFLRIRSDGCDIPTEKQLRKVLLNDFQHGCRKKTITMKSWKEAEKKHNNENNKTTY